MTLMLFLVLLVPSLAYGSYVGYFYYDNTQKVAKASEFEATGKYAEAISELNQALQNQPISIQKRTILEQRDKISILKKDEDNFSTGSKLYSDGDYEIAKSWFDLVGKESPKYTDAQVKSADCSAQITATTAKSVASAPKTTLKAAPASTAKPVVPVPTMPTALPAAKPVAPSPTISATQLAQNQANSTREANKKIAQGKIDYYNSLIDLARKYNKDELDKQIACMENAKKYLGTDSYDAWKAICDTYTPRIAKRDTEIIEYQKQADFWLAQWVSY